MHAKDQKVIVEVAMGTHTVTTYLGTDAGSYPHSTWLPQGFEFEVIDFTMVGSTNYANASDSYKFYLRDASGNTIASVTTAGVAVNPATARDSSPVAAYKYISTASAGTYLQVVPVQSGVGRVYAGLKAIITLKMNRPKA